MTDGGVAVFEAWPEVDVHVESTITGARLAAERGAEALVYSGDEIDEWGGRAAIARDLGAEIIAKSRVPNGERFTLWPTSLAALQQGDRVIFTSWNGAGCVAGATGSESIAPAVFIASLVNRTAVATAVAGLLDDSPQASGSSGRCTIIAAAEHWSSSTPGATGIRPALEDLLGAGSIAAVLAGLGYELSIEATAAMAVFEAARDEIGEALRRCVSGRELIARGFAADVDLAAQLDSFDSAPCWTQGAPERTFSDRHRTGS